MTFSVEDFKKLFPLFQQPENNDLVYFDNAATTQKPQCVIDAINDFYSKHNANANRASHRLARRATELVEATRQKVADFFGACSRNEIVFTSGATHGINIIANGLKLLLQPGDEILLTVVEHHANLVPWQELSKATATKLVISEYDVSTIEQSITENTRILSVSAASNGLGLMLDDEFFHSIKCRFPHLIIVVDASQLIAHKKIDVRAMGCDFLVCSAHKFYGPTGVGLLYGRESLLNQLTPYSYGGEMIAMVSQTTSEYRSGPERFEAGTSPLAEIAGLNACIDFLQRFDRDEIERYEQQLITYLHQSLSKLIEKNPDIQLLTQAENNVGIATIVADHIAMIDLAVWLDEANIAVRVGDHCVQPLWQYLTVRNPLRISLAAYNTFSDIDCLIEAVNHFLQQLSTTKSLGDDFSSVDWQLLFNPMPWQKKYKLLMGFSDAISAKPNIRTEANRIRSCESPLWLVVKKIEDKYYFQADSDSKILKGLAALILVQCEGKTLQDIQRIDFFSLFEKAGLTKHLSGSRINGLQGMISVITSQ